MFSSLWLIVACATKPVAGDSAEPTDSQSYTDTAQATDAGSPILSLSCEPLVGWDLIYDCSARTEIEAPLSIRHREVGSSGPWIEVESPAGTEHSFRLWELPAEAWTEVEVQAESGEPATLEIQPELPDFLRSSVFEVGGSGGEQVRYVLTATSCNEDYGLVVLDSRGRPVWARDSSETGAPAAYSLTEGGVIAVPTVLSVEEYGFDGTQRLAWGEETLVLPIQHDVFRWEDQVWTLVADSWTAPNGFRYVDHGLVAYDDKGQVVDGWTLSEEREYFSFGWEDDAGTWQSQYPNHYDPFHANAAFRDEAGNMWLSLRTTSEVLRIRPDKEGLLDTIDLRLHAGDGDLELPPEAEFAAQHHVTVQGDQLRMFDNAGDPEGSRGLLLQLDEAAGEATLVEEVPSDQLCTVAGSAVPLGEHTLLLCGTEQLIFETDASGEIYWSVQQQCDGVPRAMYRALPLDSLH